MKFSGYSTTKKIVVVLLFFVIILLASFLIYDNFIKTEGSSNNQSKNIFGSYIPELSSPEGLDLHTKKYTVGGFGPDNERREYISGSLILHIPKIDYQGPVLDGMSDEIRNGAKTTTGMDESVLNNGVVLFNQAQLPGSENRNVSIAGHRDIHGREFYNADTIGAGDQLFLYYQGKRYTYKYYDTRITDPNDWDYIAATDYSILTLQTCDPVDIATERMFVISILESIDDLSSTEAAELKNAYPSF